jgi:hypothetical protein
MLRQLALIGICSAVLLDARPAAADSADVPTPDASGVQSTAPSPVLGEKHWYNPENLPFLPIPEIGQDPDSGTTLGILPVWLITDEQHKIRRIVAPDLIYNPNFGAGFHGRLYDYPSEDKQFSLITGLSERVQRIVDGEYQFGRLRQHRWSFIGSLIYERAGEPRFFGIGNNSPQRAESNYTQQQELVQAQIGYNFSHEWQLLLTSRMRSIDVMAGTLSHIDSLTEKYPGLRGIGTNYEQLNRLSIVYDSRDNFTAPRTGMQWVAYGGAASRKGLLNDSLYSEAGIDGRTFTPLSASTVLATHVSLRYLPTFHELPFWALSSLGGGESHVGGGQPLRGYGEGRFYDRNSFSASAELRHTWFTFDAISHVELEIAPFIDVGDVFHHADQFPIEALHKVAGVGFRGIARPSVVGYVDIGYGSDGAAVFTGINYPF